MSISIFWKGLILVTVPLLFQLVFVNLIARIQDANDDTRRVANQSEQVVDDARTVLFRALDAEAELRGLLLSGKSELGDPYDHAVADIPLALRRLEDRIGIASDLSAGPAHLRHCAEAILNWLADLRRLASLGAGERAVTLASGEEGKRMMDDLRSAVDAIVEGQRRHEATQAESFERIRTRLTELLIAGKILSFVITATLAFIFWRGISARFQKLKSNISNMAAGRNEIAPLGGKDEIAQIDASFRSLVDQLGGALEASRRSSHEARDLFDQAPCGYHSVDAEGTIVAMNRTELRWLGYKSDDVIGRMKLPDLLTPAGKRDFPRKLAILKERGEIVNVEYELVRKDGTTMPVLLSSKGVTDADGKFVSSRTTLFDNTERKRAEMTIRLFADIVHNSPVGMIVWRLEDENDPRSLRLVIANPAASSSLGIDVNRLVGKTIAEAFPGISELEYRTYADVVRSGAAREIAELLYQDAQVAPNYWHVRAFPLPDHCVGVSFENVTEQKRGAEEIRRLNEDLDRRVRERTAELADANRDLNLKNQENEMFVYSVSHDLRSPLVNLQGFSIELEKGCQSLASVMADAAMPDDLRQRTKLVLDGKMAKSLGFIKSAVMRLSGIIDALLRLSRAGRVEYHVERIDLNRAVSTIVDSMHATTVEKNATVRVGTLPAVMGDKTALEQVFANLIGNALVYLDPKRPGVIEVGYQALNSDAGTEGSGLLYVKDNGLGIAEAHRQKIFQVFQRAHPGVGKGEGIGLAIVARIVERHRGRIWVESTVGQGSTFLVALPQIEQPVDFRTNRAGVPELANV